MKLSSTHVGDVAVVRVQETRLTAPILSDLAATAAKFIQDGSSRLLIDLSPVSYVDSATIGCLMDLYRQATAAGGILKLSGVQPRVETMLSMTGANNFLEVHSSEPAAIASFGG